MVLIGATCKHVAINKKRHACACRFCTTNFSWQPCCLPLFGAAAIFTGTGIDFDLVALTDEKWNLHRETGSDLGWFHDFSGRRIALDCRFGISDETRLKYCNKISDKAVDFRLRCVI